MLLPKGFLAMDADERDVYYYMKAHGREYVPVPEICRRAGSRRRFRFHSDWATPVISRMTERGILETDETGRYRLKPRPQIDMTGKVWASKQLVELLQSKGKPIDHLLVHQDDDEYYDRL